MQGFYSCSYIAPIAIQLVCDEIRENGTQFWFVCLRGKLVERYPAQAVGVNAKSRIAFSMPFLLLSIKWLMTSLVFCFASFEAAFKKLSYSA